jgi:uncharacterized protein (TIGR02569 family)
MTERYPEKDVLQAFGINANPKPLSGGEGTSFIAENAVLKPIDSEIEANWRANLMEEIIEDNFRIPKPIRAITGQWIYKGWQAYEFIEGHETKGKWEEKINVSRSFHRVLKKFPRPEFISNSNHPWGQADRMTWDENPLVYGAPLESTLKRLLSIKRDMNIPFQLIHGDMTGNILFAESLPPAIIDMSPYWRPAEYANAIICVDSIVWEGAPDTLLDQVEDAPTVNQLLVRATIWRIITSELCIAHFGRGNIDDVNSYHHFIDLLEKRKI